MSSQLTRTKSSRLVIVPQAAIACAQDAGRRQQEAAAELRACRESAAADLASLKTSSESRLRQLQAEANAAHHLLQVLLLENADLNTI
jgi:hypothetical protein